MTNNPFCPLSEKDIEILLEHLNKKYGIKKSNGYPVIMDIVTHLTSLQKRSVEE